VGEAYVIVEPEMSGRPAGRSGGELAVFVFDVWLGDDLVRAYPAVLVTARLKAALDGLPGQRGYCLSAVRAVGSRFYQAHNPGKPLPEFWVVDVDGRPGRDDMGVTADGSLVVSRRILDMLLGSRVGQAVFAQYRPGERSRRLAAKGR
jgi:hypothetical protein